MFKTILKEAPRLIERPAKEAPDREVPDKGGEWASSKSPTCMGCAHRSKVDPALCVAYPEGIPVEILMGEVDHTKPYAGDHGIQFEKG